MKRDGNCYIIKIWILEGRVVYVHRAITGRKIHVTDIRSRAYRGYRLAFVIKPKQK